MCSRTVVKKKIQLLAVYFCLKSTCSSAVVQKTYKKRQYFVKISKQELIQIPAACMSCTHTHTHTPGEGCPTSCLQLVCRRLPTAAVNYRNYLQNEGRVVMKKNFISRSSFHHTLAQPLSLSLSLPLSLSHLWAQTSDWRKQTAPWAAAGPARGPGRWLERRGSVESGKGLNHHLHHHHHRHHR